MKSAVLTPNSSTKSSTTTASSAASTESETRDNFYFPGCRKDANCECEICIESMNATLDLLPQQSAHRSTLTKLSVSRPSAPPFPRSPISFNPSTTPDYKSRIIPPIRMSPPLDSNARLILHERVNRRKKGFQFGVSVMRLFSGLSLILAMEYGFSWVVSGVLKPGLSRDVVRNLGEKSWVLEDFNERLSFLKKGVWGLVDEEISNSSFVESEWKVNQDGLLLNSRKVLYRSMTEEVSIWGWPLQTSGLLTAEFSSRSFTVLSGRVTEWTNGEVGYLIRKSNSSWVQDKWSASAVQLDPNTWILEYRRRSIVENARLFSAAFQFLKCRLVREFKHMQQEFWLMFAFGGNQYTDLTRWRTNTPT